MPRYNLNQDDIKILVDSLTANMLNCSSTKQWERIKKLKDRLSAKVENFEHPVIYDDPLWSYYQRKNL